MALVLNNSTFSFTYEASYGSEPVFTCLHPNHKDVPEEWVMEPCEHCGADITGIDWCEPEFEELDSSALSMVVQASSGYYVVHPCGHVIKGFDARELGPEELVLRSIRGE